MRIIASFLVVLDALTPSATGHASGGNPALVAKHVRVARALERVSSVSGGPVNTHIHRVCRPKRTASIVSSTLTFVVPPSAFVPTTRLTPLGSGSFVANSNPINNLINVVSAGPCGQSGATAQITALSGPNGNIDFLNCGLTSGGWTPPLVHINDIVSVELSQVAYNPGSAFSACRDFVSLFEKYGQLYGVPAIMLASFAMQESSCIPTTVGGAGEQGLMQVTADKCIGAPSGNCQDPDFNICQGAQFFSEALGSVNGDLLLAIGHYNGWHKGLTYEEATVAAQNGNCREQNNLDHLHQFLNGWMQDINAYKNDPPLGKYFNLDACPG